MTRVALERIEGVRFSSLTAHEDDRGRFLEIFRAQQFPETFVQSNHSHSRRGVLRGLHYHRHQADLWYVIAGRAQVVLADVRTVRDRPVVETIYLDANEPATLYIPAGVAHGFLAITDVDLLYWVTRPYDAGDEFGIAWDDPLIAAPWDTTDPVLSERDRNNPKLRWDQIGVF